MGIKFNIRYFICLVALIFVCSTYPDASINPKVSYFPNIDSEENRWVDSVFNALNQDQKIGQLFMIRAHSDLGIEHINAVENLIKKYYVGGLCFFQGTPSKQVELTNRYQALCPNLPLFIAMDAEWGPSMRLKGNVLQLPKQIMLGALQDNTLLYDYGKIVARHLKRLGVHINFAPVIDVNNNPANPVINDRSFGEDKYNVATKGFMYMSGLQENGIVAVGKHFPGHGDTDVDSHLDLPVINHSQMRLHDIELFPFKLLIQNGLQGIMSAHLSVPSLDPRPNVPISLSRPVLTDYLRNELGFEGLIFTDAMEMKGVLKFNPPGKAEVKALEAGNDVILLPVDLPKAFQEIKKALASGELDVNQIDNSVKRVLRAKFRSGLQHSRVISTESLEDDLRDHEAQAFKEKIIQRAITLAKDDLQCFPLLPKKINKIAVVSIGANEATEVANLLELHFQVEKIQVTKDFREDELYSVNNKTKDCDLVIFELHGMSRNQSKNFGLSENSIRNINEYSKSHRSALLIFGNPYSLKFFQNLPSVVVAYEDEPLEHKAVAQCILGLRSFYGRIPVSTEGWELYSGIQLLANDRLAFDHPQNQEMDAHKLKKIDELAKDVFNTHAAPGCQVLVARNGKIIYDKCFGYYKYDQQTQVDQNSLYDLASMTKVLSTTLAIMKLSENGVLDINKPLSDYLTELKGTNKEGLIIKDIMSHIAGLEAWIPFYKNTINENGGIKQPNDSLYRRERSATFNIKVTESLFIMSSFKDEVLKKIIESPVSSNKRYRYSDLGFYLMAELIQRLTGQSIDNYVETEFYQKLSLINTCYKPLEKFKKERIVPSEIDHYFRFQTLQGDVHDMGAAIIGGVSGHAGLFSNAYEVAEIGQMLLQKGEYGGIRFFKPETIALFTQRHPNETRRGIGFDMPQLDGSKKFNLSRRASSDTYGHTGFTGTCFWVDPKYQLVYVFLSNRTYPSMDNNTLNNKDFRERIQSAIYDAIIRH